MTHIATLLLSLAMGSTAGAPECASPPPRVSDAYWSYIDACGCARLDPPARASLDYDRFLKACSAWRERNSHGNAPVRPLSAQTCAAPPARGSEAYWDFIDACGCGKLDAPSRASADHDRFLKACSESRVGESSAEASPAPKPSSSTKPAPSASPSSSP